MVQDFLSVIRHKDFILMAFKISTDRFPMITVAIH